MNQLLKLILKLSLSGSIFFILFYIISYFTKKIMSAKWHMYILKINIAFYLIPIILPFGGIPRKYNIINTNLSNITFKSPETLNYIKSNIKVLVVIWIIGVMINIFWNVYCYSKFTKNIQKSLYIDETLEKIFYKCKLKLGIGEHINIKKSSKINSPMIIGAFKPTIIFPEEMEYSSDLIPVILHELIHYKRKDLLFKLLQLIITTIHWFNPLVYLMKNVFEQWCEISCDEVVVEDMSYIQRKAYGNTILSVIETRNNDPKVVCFHFCSNKKYIKRRLMMLLNMKKANKLKKIFGSVIVGTVTLCSMVISASATNNTNNGEAVANINEVKQSEELNVIITADNNDKNATVVINAETGEVLDIKCGIVE